MLDFTLNKYRQLCLSVLQSSYRVCGLNDYWQGEKSKGGELIAVFRHDVDRFPESALEMAYLEQQLGIQSTYYFRFTKHTFKPGIIERISSLGHEIGYHYETLSKCKGDNDAAFKLFQLELKEFRKLVPIKTICMHGSPLSKWDNRDLWKHYDFKSVGIVGEPYLSDINEQLVYLSDTGRSWDGQRFNIRDKMKQNSIEGLSGTTSLIDWLTKSGRNVMLQTHPERWPNTTLGYMISLGFDLLSNNGKKVINTIRN